MARRPGRRRLAWTLVVATTLLGGCIQVQEAAGCNAPGLFGCRDAPTQPAAEEEAPRPARDDDAER
jgi:hypothetical protein